MRAGVLGLRLFVALLVFVLALPVKSSECEAPKAVCAVADNVLRVSGRDGDASAVVIDDGVMVTTRRQVATTETIDVLLPSGDVQSGRVVPNSFPEDLVLIRLRDVRLTIPWASASATTDQDLYVIGYDEVHDAVRVYPSGRLATPLANTPQARLHHTIRSPQETKGGALVDADGRLIGIVNVAGDSRGEALPSDLLAEVRATSGPSHRVVSQKLGEAYTFCQQSIQDAEAIPRRLAPEDAEVLKRDCRATGNRHMIDLAAQALGRKLNLDDAIELSKRALELDPHAPNSFVSLIVPLHIAGRYDEEIPYLKRAMLLMPGDPQILRFALQAGVLGGDQDFADEAMREIERYLPEMAPAARAFYDNPPKR